MVPNSTAALRKKVRLHSVLHQEQLIIRKVSFVFKSKSDANNSVCRQTHSPIALHVFIFTFRYHKSSRYIMFSYMGRCLYKKLYVVCSCTIKQTKRKTKPQLKNVYLKMTTQIKEPSHFRSTKIYRWKYVVIRRKAKPTFVKGLWLCPAPLPHPTLLQKTQTLSSNHIPQMKNKRTITAQTGLNVYLKVP